MAPSEPTRSSRPGPKGPTVDPTREELRIVLVSKDWKKNETAKALGLTRYQLYRLIKEYGLKPE